jgi:hypothetical protein
MTTRVTAAEYRKMKQPKPKYRNKKVMVDGIQYDSGLEARRHGELQLLQSAGCISDLRRQVEFPYVVDGKVIFIWIADHCYKDESGNDVVEDVKALSQKKDGTYIRPTCTPVYRLKKRLIESQYGIKIFEWPEKPKTVRKRKKIA